MILFHNIFRIVADNFDLSIKSRIQTKTSSNQSVHWTHQYAIKDRVTCDPLLDDHSPQACLSDLPIHQLLPARAVQNSFQADCSVLVSRIVSKYLHPFMQFKAVVINHIPHMFSKEMENKSERVRELHSSYFTYKQQYLFSHAKHMYTYTHEKY